MTKKQILSELQFVEGFINHALRLCADLEESIFSSYMEDIREYINRGGGEEEDDDDKRRTN